MSGETSSVHPPKQLRSRRTLERIVRASLEILETEGPDGLTVQAIVDRADSSVGSFYARFTGKDELLDYVGERVWQEAATRWDAALVARDWTDVALGELIRGIVHLLGEADATRTSYLKALDRTSGAHGGSYRSFRDHVIRGVEDLLLARAGEMTHPDPRLAVPMGLHAALAVLEATAPADGELPSLQIRMDEATRLLSAYLLGDGGHARADQDVAFFDIWG